MILLLLLYDFNDHFKFAFTKDNRVLGTLEVANPPPPDIVISEEGILYLLLKLDKKFSDPDGLPNEFLNAMRSGDQSI